MTPGDTYALTVGQQCADGVVAGVLAPVLPHVTDVVGSCKPVVAPRQPVLYCSLYALQTDRLHLLLLHPRVSWSSEFTVGCQRSSALTAGHTELPLARFDTTLLARTGHQHRRRPHVYCAFVQQSSLEAMLWPPSSTLLGRSRSYSSFV